MSREASPGSLRLNCHFSDPLSAEYSYVALKAVNYKLAKQFNAVQSRELDDVVHSRPMCNQIRNVSSFKTESI